MLLLFGRFGQIRRMVEYRVPLRRARLDRTGKGPEALSDRRTDVRKSGNDLLS